MENPKNRSVKTKDLKNEYIDHDSEGKMKFEFNIRRIMICFFAVFGMGFFLAFLILCDLGTDPCTFMNRSVAAKIGLSLGNWQLLINLAMFLLVIILNKSLIGIGTIFNMVLVGYYADFFTWLWRKWLPASAFTEPLSRWVVFILSLACFIVSVAVYINAQMGVAPYDALPLIITEMITEKFPKIPAFCVRILWDGAAIVVGILAGGVPIIGIVLMSLFLGPVISIVKKTFEMLH